MAKKKKFVVSTINLRREKERVIEDMHKKLAGGSDGALSHVKRAANQRLRLIASYTLCFVMLATAATVSALQWQKVSSTALKVVSKYIAPVALMDRDAQEEKISVDEYALFLSAILWRYSSLPQEYRKGVPFLQRSDVLRKIDSVWAQLTPATKNEIARRLPSKRSPNLDLNGSVISVPPGN